jgi:hypothetical protein
LLAILTEQGEVDLQPTGLNVTSLRSKSDFRCVVVCLLFSPSRVRLIYEVKCYKPSPIGRFSVRRHFLVNVTEKTRIIYEVKCYKPSPKKGGFSVRLRFLVIVTE